MRKLIAALFLTCLLSNASFASCSDPCTPNVPEQNLTWKNKMRIKALKKLDRFLFWSTSKSLKNFILEDPLQQEIFEVDIPEVKSFGEKYGYFSAQRPIVGKVSTDELDLRLVCCLLKALFKYGDDPQYLELATAEVLSKAMAYRDLQRGQSIQIPVLAKGGIRFETYTVDQIFDLWHGMPAFGLYSENASRGPILLFRGTDFSLDSQRGWASMMSDLDMAGPGLSAFQHSQKKIREWLISPRGNEAKVMGFSLGGALAAYTFIYENEWVSKEGSIVFCPPGVANQVIEDWQRLPEDRKYGITIYVNEGDIVSKVGKLFGNVYALSTRKLLKPLSAHTVLMSAESFFYKSLVDVEKENLER